MRIVFTGGGTGGHILPNIAVIQAEQSEASAKPKAKHFLSKSSAQKSILEMFYIGEKDSFEERAALEHNIDFFPIHAGKLRRYFDLQNFIDVFKVPLGLVEAYLILRKLRPQLVFAKGGYVSVPVVFAARLLKIPVWLHESDVSPGLANRLCARFAEKIWLSFEESRKYFPGKPVEVVGNPIRAEVTEGKKEDGYRLTGFSPAKPVVLIMGGSTGSAAINNLVKEILPELLRIAQVVHITGKHGAKRSAKQLSCAEGASLFTEVGYRTFEFLNKELAHIYAITDLAVSRAGSGVIFELLACGIPMLLIPLPRTASRGDQIENAEVFERRGFATFLDQEKTTAQGLLESIRKTLTKTKIHAPINNAAKAIAEAIMTKFVSSPPK